MDFASFDWFDEALWNELLAEEHRHIVLGAAAAIAVATACLGMLWLLAALLLSIFAALCHINSSHISLKTEKIAAALLVLAVVLVKTAIQRVASDALVAGCTFRHAWRCSTACIACCCLVQCRTSAS